MKSPARRHDWRDLQDLRQDPNNELLEFIGLTEFETISDCVARNVKMVARLHRAGKADEIWEKFQASAWDRYQDGWEGDWLACRGHRARIIPQAYRVLSQHPGPQHFVSIVHPKWEMAEGKLKSLSVEAAKQWLRRRLKLLEACVVAVGGFECSLRVDQKADPYWAGHFHLVETGRKAIVLNAPAIAVISSLERKGQYVIFSEQDDKPRADLNRPWRTISARAGLVSVRIHDLRHTHASVGAAAGLSLPILGKLLGHSQAMTTQRYAHLSFDPLKDASDKIGTAIVQQMGDAKGR